MLYASYAAINVGLTPACCEDLVTCMDALSDAMITLFFDLPDVLLDVLIGFTDSVVTTKSSSFCCGMSSLTFSSAENSSSLTIAAAFVRLLIGFARCSATSICSTGANADAIGSAVSADIASGAPLSKGCWFDSCN